MVSTAKPLYSAWCLEWGRGVDAVWLQMVCLAEALITLTLQSHRSPPLTCDETWVHVNYHSIMDLNFLPVVSTRTCAYTPNWLFIFVVEPPLVEPWCHPACSLLTAQTSRLWILVSPLCRLRLLKPPSICVLMRRYTSPGLIKLEVRDVFPTVDHNNYS